ncbi:MAG: hypothetical protein JWQ12_1639 [Glaciihabitans sp.]|jgi:hypothetical protein|nr:hypothetical protein [Glaciihabitans sp.]
MTPIPVAAICYWDMRDGSRSETYLVDTAATWLVYGGLGLGVPGIVLLRVKSLRETRASRPTVR